MTLHEAQDIWRNVFERDSDGGSEAKSMDSVMDMDAAASTSLDSPGPTAVSSCPTQYPPAADFDQPGTSAVSHLLTQSPPYAPTPPSTQYSPAATSTDSSGTSAVSYPSKQSPPSAVCPPSAQSPAANPHSTLVKRDDSQLPHTKRRVPPSTQYPAAAYARPNGPGPSALSPPSTHSPAAHTGSTSMKRTKWDNSQSLHAQGRVIYPESEEGWNNISNKDEESLQFPAPAAAAASASRDSPGAPVASSRAETASASPDSSGPSAVSPPSTQYPTAATASAISESPGSLVDLPPSVLSRTISHNLGPSVFLPLSTQSPHDPTATTASANSDSSGPPYVSPPSMQYLAVASATSGSLGSPAVSPPLTTYSAAAAVAYAISHSPGPSAVSPPSAQFLPAHPRSTLVKRTMREEKGWHDLNNKDEKPWQFPAPAVTGISTSSDSPGTSAYSLPSIQSLATHLCSNRVKRMMRDDNQSPHAQTRVIHPESEEGIQEIHNKDVVPRQLPDPATATVSASSYSPETSAVSPPSTQYPAATTASASSDCPGPPVAYSPSIPYPPAAYARSDSHEPSAISPPLAKYSAAASASASSDSPGPLIVSPPSTQAPAAHPHSSLVNGTTREDSQSSNFKRREMYPESEEGWYDANNDEEHWQFPALAAAVAYATSDDPGPSADLPLSTTYPPAEYSISHRPGPSIVSPPPTQYPAAAYASSNSPVHSAVSDPLTQYPSATYTILDGSGPPVVSPLSKPYPPVPYASSNCPVDSSVSPPLTQNPVAAHTILDGPGGPVVTPPSTQSPAACPHSNPLKRKKGKDSQSLRAKRKSEERWHDIDEEDVAPRHLIFRPKRTPGVQLDRQRDYSPVELFQLFFSKEVMNILAQNTTKNIERRRAQGLRTAWAKQHVDAADLLKYISLVIYLGLVNPPSFRDLWRKDRLHTHPFPASVMAGHSYHFLGSLIHMSDPAEDIINDKLKGQEGYDPLSRLKPLQNQILTACRAYYHPHKNLAIDERIVATKDQIGMKQYVKNKPMKCGFKLFVLADSKSGYTCEFRVYPGKKITPRGNSLRYDAVVNLLRVPFLGTGFHLFVDHYYTSTALFRHLHKIRFGACGTMRESLACFPKTTVNALPKVADRGEMRWIRDGPLLFVKWKDNKEVCLCSTIHKAYGGHSVQRRVKSQDGTWSSRTVPVPEPVVEYNKYMGGVDLSDALIKYYNVSQKTIRWYKRFFLHFVDIAVVNSYIIHKELKLAKRQRPMTQKQFRETLCLQLADVGKNGSTRQETIEEVVPAVPVAPEAEVEKETEKETEDEKPQFSCYPVTVRDVSSTSTREKGTKGRLYCVNCVRKKVYNKTIYKCNSCDVPLCIIVDRICFTEWHDLKNSQAHSTV